MVGRIGQRALAAGTELSSIAMLPYAAAKSWVVERGKSRALVVRSAVLQLGFTAVEPLALFVGIALVAGFAAVVLTSRLLGPTALGSAVPAVVAHAVVVEIVPLVLALVMVGRSGTAVTTELGFMRVDEEVDALDACGVNVDYLLVLPRLLGITAAAAGLCVVMSAVGLLGGWLLATALGLLGAAVPLWPLVEAVDPYRLGLALLKSVLFGVTIAAVSCHFGLTVGRVASAIPRANGRAAMWAYFLCFLQNTAVSLAVQLA